MTLNDSQGLWYIASELLYKAERDRVSFSELRLWLANAFDLPEGVLRMVNSGTYAYAEATLPDGEKELVYFEFLFDYKIGGRWLSETWDLTDREWIEYCHRPGTTYRRLTVDEATEYSDRTGVIVS